MEHPNEKGGGRKKLKTKEIRKNLIDKEEKNPTKRGEKNYWQREEQKNLLTKRGDFSKKPTDKERR